VSEHPFTDVGISRRQFLELSAATGAALSLPGNATAEADAAAFDTRYRYVQRHTPAAHAVPTAIDLTDATGIAAVGAIDPDARTTTDPAPAAFAALTTEQAVAVADLPTAADLHFAPGGNPFWRLGYYPLGTFPDPGRCVDYLDIEEVAAGFDRLAERHDRMRTFGIGPSVGKYNYLSDRRDPRDVMVVELAEDIDGEHPLVTDRDPIQDHLWYIAPLGYAEDEAPVTSIDGTAFDGTVAGTVGGDVAVGTLELGDGTIQIIGSLLPPANQGDLHPFGMLDYAATYLGHLVTTNALFAQQVHEVDDEEVLHVGRGGN
jgi:hypothetical protein